MKTYIVKMLGLFVLGLLLFSQQAESQTNVDASMTVDNQFTAYLSTDDGVQGTQIGTGNNWPSTYQFGAALTPGVTNYLHIVATDLGPPAMFIGEFNLSDTGFEFTNGTQTLLTNTSGWQVSTTGFGVSYVAPSDLGGQGTPPWGTFPLIDAAARFIWHPVGPGNTVYFSTAIVPSEGGVQTTRASFFVTKQYSDGNDDQVEVTLSCNNGLPLEQSFLISDGNPVNFVVTHFTEGEMDCEVTETGTADGYTPSYDNGSAVSNVSCAYTDVASGEFSCAISNAADPATFTVYKEWVIEGAVGHEVLEEARGTIYCNNEIQGGGENGSYYFLSDILVGDGDSLTATVDTTLQSAQCWAEEDLFESGVESENDCGSRSIPAGGSSSCTFTNTVFFEGIPTLSQIGLALLALLMLGVGLVGLRRFV
jgi:MSHA biogenesis protein MshQ